MSPSTPWCPTCCTPRRNQRPPSRSRLPPRPPPPRRYQGVQHDAPSFTIDHLPAEAFEALLVVTSWMGEVLVDDPPYVLEVHLTEPGPCWCRLDLVPDAGGSTVTPDGRLDRRHPSSRRRARPRSVGVEPQPPLTV